MLQHSDLGGSLEPAKASTNCTYPLTESRRADVSQGCAQPSLKDIVVFTEESKTTQKTRTARRVDDDALGVTHHHEALSAMAPRKRTGPIGLHKCN